MESGINGDQNFYSRPLHHSHSPKQIEAKKAHHQPDQHPHLSSPRRHHAYDPPPPPPEFESRTPQPQLPAKLPFLTTANLQVVTANGYDGGMTEGGDPAEFYREYRGVQQASKGYTDITTNGMAATASESRAAPSSLRSNGNGTTPKHPSLPGRMMTPSYRSASSPLDDRMSLSSPKSTSALNGFPRSQQPSVKDLLKRFDQNNEQSSTTRKPAPRLSSKDSATAGPGYSRDRPAYIGRTVATSPSTTAIPRGGQTYTRDHKSSKPKSPDRPRATQRARFATEDQHSNNTLSGVPRSTRARISTSGDNVQASKSMTNLSPTSPTPNSSQTSARRPLFGEVLPIGQGSDNIGYGIPHAAHSATRRTSDSSLHPNWSHRRSRSDLDVSPSSPTAWYLGVTPTLDDVDPNKSSRSTPGHNRNHSDFADTKVNTMNGPNHAS
ncbi:hypothetical protein G7Y89_g15432 [Cudoniella acicularis]|uniref:Uncharacterized protein n=1 Tax=Cudoniella acicularis TaxID=354080 RepID=A0A8H4QPA6_9HELO|nr:hypothetical protein G7Y89_g15432 [Cudoniella acicularis]